MNADRPCTCPAFDPNLGWHTVTDHEQDCGSTQPGEACGGCWGCIALDVGFHQVLRTIRGGAA